MTDSDSIDTDGHSDRKEGSPTHPARGCRVVIVEYDGEPDRCTIVPRGLDSEDVMTTWITATRTDLVDLSSVV